MKRRLLCAVTVLLLLCGLLTACNAPSAAQKEKYSIQSFGYFDTVAIITGYETSRQEFDAVAQQILDRLGEYHRLYTVYHRFDGLENLCTVNETVDGVHRTVKVDRRIIDLLLYAKQMYTQTGGMMNVAMGSVLSLWHDYRIVGQENPSEATLPPTELLQQAAEHIDPDKVVIDEQNCTVTLTDPLMKLDVGAIAKGYATEQIAQWLEQQGKSGYLLNIGGNVRTIGPRADGTPWLIGMENPDTGDYSAYLKLDGQSIVTSGSYLRYYTVNGKQYHHIIHPDTQMPAQGFVSVSVVCRDSGLGDALSTALFCMSLQQGMELVESLSGVEAMWIAEDRTQTVSSGWNRYVATV